MMTKAIRIATLAALMLGPAAVQAQESLSGWQGLNPSSLDTVYVTDDAGRTTEGKLLKLDRDSLVMLVNGAEQRFEASQILRIDKRGDSLKNGTLIGLGLGLVFGSIAAGISDCSGDDPGGDCTGYRVVGFVTGVGVYTALGTAIDALIVGRTRVFDGRENVANRGIPGGPQLALRVRW